MTRDADVGREDAVGGERVTRFMPDITIVPHGNSAIGVAPQGGDAF
jgi:hypothetical protein